MSQIQYLTLPFIKVGFYEKNAFIEPGDNRSSAPLHQLTDFGLQGTVVDSTPLKPGHEAKEPEPTEISLTFSDFRKAPHYDDHREEQLLATLRYALEDFMMQREGNCHPDAFKKLHPNVPISHAQVRAMLNFAEIANESATLKLEYDITNMPMLEIGLGYGVMMKVVPSHLNVSVQSQAGGLYGLLPFGEEEPTITGTMKIFKSENYRFCIWRKHNNKSFVQEVSPHVLQAAMTTSVLKYYDLFQALGLMEDIKFDKLPDVASKA